MSKTFKIKKTMVFIPKDLKDTYLDLPYGKVPELIMLVKGDDINCRLDRKCPCDCENRIEYFKLHKEDLEGWLKTNSEYFRIS